MEFGVSNVIRLALYALAVFRVTHMLWYEDGPWDVFDWIRAKAGIKYDTYTVYTYDDASSVPSTVEFKRVVPDKFFARLLDCPLCISLWLAIPAVLAWQADWKVLDILAIWLAISAVQLFLFGWEHPE